MTEEDKPSDENRPPQQGRPPRLFQTGPPTLRPTTPEEDARYENWRAAVRRRAQELATATVRGAERALRRLGFDKITRRF